MLELSLHILDVIENAVEAGASRIRLQIDENLESDLLTIEIVDNGRGMSGEVMKKALDPFYTSRVTRHVGLGLPLFLEAARRCDGGLSIQSEPGRGARVQATFRHSHIDRAPLGNVPSALLAILLSERAVDIEYNHRVGDRSFHFDTREIREELGEVPLTYPTIRDWLLQELREGEASLREPSIH